MHYCFELLTPETIYDAAAFVRQHEYRCIDLAEQLRLCLYPDYAPRYKKAAAVYACPQRQTCPQPQKICCGVLLFSTYGLLFHCIDTDIPEETVLDFGRFFLSEDFPYKELHAVAGIREHTLLFERVMSEAAHIRLDAAVDYYLMRCAKPCTDTFFQTAESKLNTTLNAALSIERATENDLIELFPLQLDYENTEVAYEGRPINPAVCKLSLCARLTTEYIYKVSADGHIVAKAGTNAQGFHWFQIGGVYTLPAYRNKGLAAAAVAHLINTHSAEAHGFALFVKTANTAALRVYKKLGFEQCGLLRMSYWKARQDPFYSPENSAVLDKRIADIRTGKNVSGHELIGE
ncbi:GNAT family N-acetyltransferase [Treponema vincentii]|uniref:GNAT family N-acetyltransferase n=1 Tax=Treponema vincentii TaxID=69710 RepID=A0A6P1Y223_9SPIR|nr:GNAT family N-acetyltransferase [Treponema vincentii]QHX43310.1 GNAT family N-acetyltransferase [Treponema vincentii]